VVDGEEVMMDMPLLPNSAHSFSPHLCHSPPLFPLHISRSLAEGSIASPRSMKEWDDSLKESRKENFSLRMRIYFLEERLAMQAGREIGEEIDLKVQMELLKKENEEKLELLVEATNALEALETQIKEEKEKYTKTVKGMEEEIIDLSDKLAEGELKKFSNEHLKDVTNDVAKDTDQTEKMLLAVLKDLEGIPSEPVIETNQIRGQDGLQEELEALNETIKNKNAFISLLHSDLEATREETQGLRKQIQKREEKIRMQEEHIRSLRMVTKLGRERRKKLGERSVGTNTENTLVENLQRIEEELVFKDQELKELQTELRDRDEKIVGLEQMAGTQRDIWTETMQSSSRNKGGDVGRGGGRGGKGGGGGGGGGRVQNQERIEGNDFSEETELSSDCDHVSCVFPAGVILT